MQIVMKIDKELYKTLQKKYILIGGMRGGKTLLTYLLSAIAKGKSLPEEHGRLIDADALRKDDEVTEWLSINPIRTGKNLKMFSELFVKKIDDAPTIIEAEGNTE